MPRRVPILLALLFMLSCDSEAPLTGPETFEPFSGVANLGAFLVPKVLLLDEDAIGKGLAPNSFDEEDVNEGIADIELRAQLPFFAARADLDVLDPERTITLHSGEVGDEGWFALTTTPDAWDAAGPTDDGLRNYFGNPSQPFPHDVGPGLGSGDDPEALLDKIEGVTPLRAMGLAQLQGHTVCAVVYKSDVSINYGPLTGSLKGDNLGTVAFRVLSVTRLTGSSSSSLPAVEILMLDADLVCEGTFGGPPPALTLFDDAPEPISSSEPFDVRPPEAGAQAECLDELGNVIDCDIVVVPGESGGSAGVFDDPGEVTQTLAGFITIDPNDAVNAAGEPVEEFELILQLVEAPPSEEIPVAQQVPFFIDVDAVDGAGNDVFFVEGALIVLCQPPDLDATIPDELHFFLRIFAVNDDGSTEILETTVDPVNCPGEAHGGLRTRRRAFSGFGATLPTNPSVSTAEVPDGSVGSPTVIEIQARLFSDELGTEDQILGGDEVLVTVTGANTVTLSTETETITDNGDGTYSAEYPPTVGGEDNVDIKIRNIDGGLLEPISGSPFTSVVAGAAALCSFSPAATIVPFEDPALEAAIRDALELGAEVDLTCELVSGVGGLDAGSIPGDHESGGDPESHEPDLSRTLGERSQRPQSAERAPKPGLPLPPFQFIQRPQSQSAERAHDPEERRIR